MHNIMLVTSNAVFFSREFEDSNKKAVIVIIDKVTDNLQQVVLCQIMAFLWYSQTVKLQKVNGL